MGRKRDIFIREFFYVDNELQKSVCKICGAAFQGTYVTNLKRHIIKKHLELYVEERESIEKRDEEKSCEEKKTFSVKFSIEEVTNACIEFVTNDFQPFSLFDSHAFRVLTEQIFKGLHMSPISSTNIMNYVTEKYLYMKSEIKKLIKGRMISLKMDIATRHERSLLGINIQLINNNKIFVYTLSMKQLKRRHTAENLKNEIETVLQEFDIKKNQIYSITTDNGRNILKAVELISDENDVEVDEERERFSNESYDNNNEQCVDDVIQNFCNEYQNIISVKCAAHTLQLAVKDYLAENKIELIHHARQVVKTLKTSTFR